MLPYKQKVYAKGGVIVTLSFKEAKLLKGLLEMNGYYKEGLSITGYPLDVLIATVESAIIMNRIYCDDKRYEHYAEISAMTHLSEKLTLLDKNKPIIHYERVDMGIRELLEFVMGFIEEPENEYVKNSGLCKIILYLWDHGVLTKSEHHCLFDNIKENRPQYGEEFWDSNMMSSPYYFTKGDMEIRVKWLKHLMVLYSGNK